MNHNEAIKAIMKAISNRIDAISEIDEGKYSDHDQLSVSSLRKRLVKEEINLTESLMFLRENQALEATK